MAKATFYYHLKRIDFDDGYDDLRNIIKTIFEKHHSRYGYRRITLALHGDGIYVNHKTVSKLMRQMHLKALRTPRQFHTYKGNIGKVAPNTVNRNFRAKEPNKKWTTDVTQVLIKDERIYLSPILDMFNGEIITYTITSRPDLKMVIDMVQKAMKKVPEHNGLILHSDQGWHYQHVKYQNELRINGIEQSMSRKGNCLDNAMMENFFGIMKTELLYSRQWNSMDEFKRELRKYIHYYNYDRIKLRLNGLSPVQYRTQNS